MSRTVVSTVMAICTKSSKITSEKINSGLNPKMFERDLRDFKRTVAKKSKNTAANVTSVHFTHLNNTVSTRTKLWELQKTGSGGKAAILKPLIKKLNGKLQKIVS